jgi:hypothetical protein
MAARPSTKIRDAGKNAQLGANTPQAGFVNPNPGGMLNSAWDKASR